MVRCRLEQFLDRAPTCTAAMTLEPQNQLPPEVASSSALCRHQILRTCLDLLTFPYIVLEFSKELSYVWCLCRSSSNRVLRKLTRRRQLLDANTAVSRRKHRSTPEVLVPSVCIFLDLAHIFPRGNFTIRTISGGVPSARL